MLKSLKRRAYFITASYFAFWAKLVLLRWRPRICVITGSSGKTTLLHLVEAQMGAKAGYSHHANGAFGIPFDILGMEPNVPAKPYWLLYMLRAPLQALIVRHDEPIYIVEADCDRPHEGYFLARLLKPEVTLWVSLFHTHSMNFDSAVRRGEFRSPIEAIGFEFSHYARFTTQLVIYNHDAPEIVRQIGSLPKDAADSPKYLAIGTAQVEGYAVTQEGTAFTVDGQKYTFNYLLPPAVGVSLAMLDGLLKHFGIQHDPARYDGFEMPPGRSSIFKGKNDITIVDSTYNTGVLATEEVMRAFHELPGRQKWLVLGDVLEQGAVEQAEHEALARHVIQFNASRVVLLGRRQHQYGLPLLLPAYGDRVASFKTAGEVLQYLQKELTGGEVLLFKGAQGLEGVIEQLLQNQADEQKLVRRGRVWARRRRAWGLPA